MADPMRALPQSIRPAWSPLTITLPGWTSPCNSVGVSRARVARAAGWSAAAVTSAVARAMGAAPRGLTFLSMRGNTHDRHSCLHHEASTRGMIASSPVVAPW